MTFAAYEIGGPNVTSWLYFNPATDELFGAVPMSMRGTVELAVIATDSQHMIAEDLFSVTFAPNPSGHTGIGAATLGMVTPINSSQVAALLTLHG